MNKIRTNSYLSYHCSLSPINEFFPDSNKMKENVYDHQVYKNTYIGRQINKN